jgi:Mannanase, galactose-binding domain-like/PEP-CTERM motif
MKSRRLLWVASVGLLAFMCSPAMAQLPGEIYTWDQSYGESVGPDVEGWYYSFGNNPVTLDNVTDGVLTVTESTDLDWAINDSFNRIRESSAPNDFGGLDLTGLDTLELLIGHNGTQTYGGQIYMQTPNPGCCDFDVPGGFSVNPGAPQVVSVPLSGLTADKISWIRTIGIQMFDHSWSSDGPLTWTIEEVRSAGTPLKERYLSPEETANDLDGAVVKFDSAAIAGASDDSPTGLSTIANDLGGQALRWVDGGNGSGAAIAWGNGRDGYNAVQYDTRPYDLRNYDYVDVRIRAQAGAGADPSVDVQFYFQTTDAYTYQSAGDLTLDADSQYHILTFPLSAITNLGDVQWHGINLGPHAGNMDIRVDYVRFYSVPEPSSLVLFGIAACAAVGFRRRRS